MLDSQIWMAEGVSNLSMWRALRSASPQTMKHPHPHCERKNESQHGQLARDSEHMA